MRDVSKPVSTFANRYSATSSLDINLHKIDAPEFSKDLLLGAEEVATWMFGPLKRRRLYHLIETGRGIPTFRLGSKIAAQKSVLRAAFWAQQKRALNSEDIERLVRLQLVLLKTREVFGATDGDDAGVTGFDRAEFRLAMNEACNVIDSFLDSA
jgi:hypothetical protein